MSRDQWDAALAPALRHTSPWLDRLVVVDTCGSTQDEAMRLSDGRPGLVVVGLRQTTGRGRLGRPWIQQDALGLALSAALDSARLDPTLASIATGLAAWRACHHVVEQCDGRGDDLRLRWPNDVVIRENAEPERKIAGVLIERRDPLLVVGVGINVLQGEHDFPEHLRTTAASLAQCCQSARRPTRVAVCQALLHSLAWALSLSREQAAEHWRRLDALTGTHRAFVCDGVEIRGVVERVDPFREIIIASDSGETLALDCHTAVRVPG